MSLRGRKPFGECVQSNECDVHPLTSKPSVHLAPITSATATSFIIYCLETTHNQPVLLSLSSVLLLLFELSQEWPHVLETAAPVHLSKNAI